MTTFERFEREIPGLMDEIASPRVPDYLDDMLRQTGRTRQRPAWASLERWLPMDVVARPTILRAPALRPLLILLIIGLLVAAGLALYAGSQQTRLPAPFGPARNGSILYSTADGDIHAVDPTTAASRAVVTGPSADVAPLLSRDGTRFLFVRRGTGATADLLVANVDGSGARAIHSGTYLISGVDRLPFDWSPDSSQIALASTVDGVSKLTIVAADGSASRTLDVGLDVSEVSWRPGGDEILFRGAKSEDGALTYGFYVVDTAGTSVRAVLPPSTLEFGWRGPVMSPDGKLAAFSRWGSDDSGIHLVDIDTGTDRLLTYGAAATADAYLPAFSPDGSELVVVRYVDDTSQLVVVPVVGGDAVPIGPTGRSADEEPSFRYSPDGEFILAFYGIAGPTWLLDPDGGPGREVTWPGTEFQSWQRLAP
jgi:dipeptidyl aminopeptidase/acylaminoacyl peptidase